MKKYFKSLMVGFLALCFTVFILSCSNAADGASGGSSEKKPATYTITFNANDGSAQPATATQTFTEGKAQTLKTITELGFSKTGHNFAGWGLTADAAQSSYVDGATYTATSGVTFYALWSLIPVKKYHVSVVSNGHGTAYASSEDAAEGTEVTINLVPENGYEMSSLSVIDADSNAITVENRKFIMPSSDVTVTAEFSLCGVKTATLDTLIDVIKQLSGNATIVLTGAVKDTDLGAIKGAINMSRYDINLDLSQVTGLTKIPQNGFRSCKLLSGISLPVSVKEIGEDAFYYCQRLQSITIPNNVSSIEKWAFRSCISLKSVEIPNSVTFIGEMPFYCCQNLLNINVDENNENFSSVDGVLFSKDKKTLIYCPERKGGRYTIPDTVNTIKEYAFYGANHFLVIEMPDSVTTIGERAFDGCQCLEYLKISNNVITIGDYAFNFCEMLPSLEIPNSVEYIGSFAFHYCYSLESLKFNDVNGWYYTDNEEDWKNKTNGTAMPDLSNAENNANYFDDYDSAFINNSGIYDNKYLYKLSSNN